jgi:hypothetical protein
MHIYIGKERASNAYMYVDDHYNLCHY